MSLGKRIKEQRTSCGLSQEKVAELMDVSRQAVTKWENDQSAPSTKNLFKLAEIFRTTVDILIDSKESSEDRKQSLTEHVYYLYKLQEDKKQAERLKAVKLMIIIFGIMALVLLTSAGIYFFNTPTATITIKTQAIIGSTFFCTSASLAMGYYLEKKRQAKTKPAE
jgi:transcriptional regulator with XRE-family HTH domain